MGHMSDSLNCYRYLLGPLRFKILDVLHVFQLNFKILNVYGGLNSIDTLTDKTTTRYRPDKRPNKLLTLLKAVRSTEHGVQS